MLPLFPLGTVLFPGLVLPLHIFELRYRQLVRDLLAGPEPRCFGVIAIRKGRETGVAGVSSLYGVGCTATLRQVTEHSDGRYDVVTVGTQRFVLTGLDDPRPYLTGQVDLLDEPGGEPAAAARAARSVQRAFGSYVDALAGHTGTQVSTPDLPDEPVALSYLVAASMVTDLSDRQALLAEPDALARLTAERALLGRQTAMMRSLTSAPAPYLRDSPYSPN
jgi:uncharacterized protein